MIFFAEDAGTGWLVLISGAVGGAITAGATALGKLLQLRHDLDKESRADAMTDWKSQIVAQLEGQIDRQTAVISKQQDAMDKLKDANAECREDAAEQVAMNKFFYDLLKRQHQMLKSLGHDPGDLPEMPKSREGNGEKSAQADFAVRQAQQSVELLKAAAQVLPKPNEGASP